MLDGRGIRLQRLMGNSHGVVVAIDHGLFDGPISGMEDLPVTAAKIDDLVDLCLKNPRLAIQTESYTIE